MEDITMMPHEAAARTGPSISFAIGEPVTLVLDGARFFGWVVPASQAHSLACVTVEFKRGGTRVRELIPVENLQPLREYIQAHPACQRGSTALKVEA
jgi:hypothetical protein